MLERAEASLDDVAAAVSDALLLAEVTLDGCVHCEEGLPPGAESMAFWADETRGSDTLFYGRITYELMDGTGRRPDSGEWPDSMDDSEVAFSEVMDPMRKVVASGTLDAVDWNAELIRGDVVDARPTAQ